MRSWILRAGEIWLSFLLLRVERGWEALSETKGEGRRKGKGVEGRRLRGKSVKGKREASLRERRVLEKLEESGNGGRGMERGSEAGASVARGRVGWGRERLENIVPPRDPED